MDPQLKQAAIDQDVKFLRKALDCKPREYFFTSDKEGYNFIHIAVRGLPNTTFLNEVVQRLPKEDVQLLFSQQDNLRKWNPLHLAAFWGNREVIQIILSVYTSLSSWSGLLAVEQYPPGGKPWLARAKDGRTPLHLCLEFSEEECGLEILSMDFKLLSRMDNFGKSPLYYAVDRGFNKFALKILACNFTCSVSGLHDFNPKHIRSRCSEVVWKLLYKKYPEFLFLTNEDKTSLLHEWAKEGGLQPLLMVEEITCIDSLEKLSILPNSYGDLPLHTAIKHDNEEFALCLVEKCGVIDPPLWQRENNYGVAPLDLALERCNEDLVLQFFSMCSRYSKVPNYHWRRWLVMAVENRMSRVVEKICSNVDLELILGEFFSQSSTIENCSRQTFLNIMSHCTVLEFISRDRSILEHRRHSRESRLFIAVEKGMDAVVQTICEYVAANPTQVLVPTENHDGDGRTIFYVLSNCTETTAVLLLKTFPHLINKPHNNGMRPIDIASEFGAGWLTKLLITLDPSSIEISPNVWIELCKRGHLEAVEAFIKNYDDFRQLCIEQEDSPLHRIKLATYQDYEKFLAIPLVWEMKNRRDNDGKTPLHRALEREDILFSEVLLQKGVNRSIRDKRRKTAPKLLARLCDQYYEWEEMCQRVGINPRLRNLGSSTGEMRTNLSVVAALLATLTFAAAFTVPGGFDQNTGEVILAKKTGFLVFILADTYAMCCAMFVLFCLIWSMVCDEDEAQLLIDRSVLVLIQSFYGTLMAFMTGIYTVMYHKSLWAAILICVMCSIVGISTNRSVLFRVLDKLDIKDESRFRTKIWEQVEVKLTSRKGVFFNKEISRRKTPERDDPLANV